MTEEIKQPVEEQKAPEAPQEEEYSYKDIHEPTTRELATPEKKEEPKEEKKEEVKEEKKEVKEEPKEDTKQVAEEAARKIIEEARKEEAEKKAKEEEQKAKEQTTEEEKEYEKWASQFEKDNSRPPTYLEAMKFVSTQVENNLTAKAAQEKKAQEEKQKQQQDAEEAARKAQQEERDRINKFVDDEMSELYAAKQLTAIKDKSNPSDQGVVERKEFFKQWMEVNQQRLAEGKPEIISATRFYHNHYKKPSAQPAGADVPIAGSQSDGTSPAGADDIDYIKDVAKPWRFFKRG